MVWQVIAKAGIALAKKYIAKRLVYESLDWLTGEDDFVKKKNITGIRSLDEQKAIDKSKEQDITDAYSKYLEDIPVNI